MLRASGKPPTAVPDAALAVTSEESSQGPCQAFRTQADKAKVDSSAANVYLCPPLHESFQLLSQLLIPPSADLLQSYRDAMPAKGQDDVRRRYLLEILAPNYRAAMAT
ncbi:unnamed protein product [Vitrella brassicaformis CCMP3155]|uniref:Uncharacterized protein n=1 Tax=Vitrella brassicaformis (strain CCMP3155) TaxID=1169540 RepID=A0A0G4GVT6_VITBC|nr:unnamed protein product [Vitrella brassicaformis CCMP3155]|eukprot:CEM34992.1 unnamed protein product [Vitrella brassicaformis CCMP3155]